jgi:hypothetical protein
MKKEIEEQIIKNIEEMKTEKYGLFRNLIKSNSGVSSKNFFLVSVTIIGVFMLSIIAAGLIVDIAFHHTITISMSDASYFIGAIGTLFASAGITKAWSDSSTHKYLAQHPQDYKQPQTVEEEELEELIPEEDEENI